MACSPPGHLRPSDPSGGGIQRGAPGVFASLRSALFLDGLSARDAIPLSVLRLRFASTGSSILWELRWSLMEQNGASWELPAHAVAQDRPKSSDELRRSSVKLRRRTSYRAPAGQDRPWPFCLAPLGVWGIGPRLVRDAIRPSALRLGIASTRSSILWELRWSFNGASWELPARSACKK
jgi:hypothetical protein